MLSPPILVQPSAPHPAVLGGSGRDRRGRGQTERSQSLWWQRWFFTSAGQWVASDWPYQKCTGFPLPFAPELTPAQAVTARVAKHSWESKAVTCGVNGIEGGR